MKATTKKEREIVYNMFDGICAYSGTELLNDWQIDHKVPIIRNRKFGGALFEEKHNLDNMLPTQRIINHYKRTRTVNEFRNLLLTLHLRLAKLPKKTKLIKTAKRKEYLYKVAEFFDIGIDKPFSGVFYFENFNKKNDKK